MSFLFEDKTLNIPDGLIYDTASDIEAKIIRFKQAGTDQLQVVLDFDRTLTEKNKQDSVSWQLMRNHLPPQGRVEAQKVFDHYRAIEIAEELTTEDAVAWWTASMGIITKYRLDMTVVERDFLSQSTIRPGTKELFDLCTQYNIPTVILSAGVKDVIDIWCKTYDIHPTIILSTTLKLDEKNRVVGWDADSIVHTLNKKEIGHPELTRIRAERSHTILAGDSMHDYDMAEGKDAVFRIRICDVSDDENQPNTALRTQTLKVFDSMIEQGTLEPVTQLIKQIAE